MDILTTIPDADIPAWQYRVDQFNAGSGQPPITIAQFCQNERDLETAKYSDAYATYQMEQLIPVGTKYLAAPKDVQTQVDTLLAPYS